MLIIAPANKTLMLKSEVSPYDNTIEMIIPVTIFLLVLAIMCLGEMIFRYSE